MMFDADRFPSAPQSLALVLVVFLAEYLLGALFHDFQGSLGLTYDQRDALVMLLANGLVLSWLLHVKHMGYGQLLHPSPASPGVTLVLLVPPVALLVPWLVMAAGVVSSILLAWFPMSASEARMFERMAGHDLPVWLMVCVLAPVLEEMLFRGIILRAFLRLYPRWTALGASALVFGFAHLNLYQFVVASALGLCCGWLYERSQSLLPGVALHGLYNAALSFGEPLGMTDAKGDPVLSGLRWGVATGAAVLGVWLLWRLLGVKAPGVSRGSGR